MCTNEYMMSAFSFDQVLGTFGNDVAVSYPRSRNNARKITSFKTHKQTHLRYIRARFRTQTNERTDELTTICMYV